MLGLVADLGHFALCPVFGCVPVFAMFRMFAGGFTVGIVMFGLSSKSICLCSVFGVLLRSALQQHTLASGTGGGGAASRQNSALFLLGPPRGL